MSSLQVRVFPWIAAYSSTKEPRRAAAKHKPKTTRSFLYTLSRHCHPRPRGLYVDGRVHTIGIHLPAFPGRGQGFDMLASPGLRDNALRDSASGRFLRMVAYTPLRAQCGHAGLGRRFSGWRTSGGSVNQRATCTHVPLQTMDPGAYLNSHPRRLYAPKSGLRAGPELAAACLGIFPVSPAEACLSIRFRLEQRSSCLAGSILPFC